MWLLPIAEFGSMLDSISISPNGVTNRQLSFEINCLGFGLGLPYLTYELWLEDDSKLGNSKSLFVYFK